MYMLSEAPNLAFGITNRCKHFAVSIIPLFDYLKRDKKLKWTVNN